MDAQKAKRFRERLTAQRGLDGARLDRSISRLLGDLESDTRRWASELCAANGDRTRSHLDDVHNLIRLELAGVFRGLLATPHPVEIENLPAYFRRIASRAAYAYYHSSVVTGLGGSTGRARRAGAIHSVRRDLAIEQGREPSDAEVVAEVNRRAHATRSDPRKQGALVTLADLAPSVPISLDALLEVGGTDTASAAGGATGGQTGVADDPLERPDAERLIARVLEVCASVSEPLGAAAGLWIGESLADPPIVRSADEIAERMTLAADDAAELLHGCRTVASLICDAEFGIASPFG